MQGNRLIVTYVGCTLPLVMYIRVQALLRVTDQAHVSIRYLVCKQTKQLGVLQALGCSLDIERPNAGRLGYEKRTRLEKSRYRPWNERRCSS